MTTRRRLLVGAAVGLAVQTLGCGAPTQGTIGAVLLRKQDRRIFVRAVPGHLAAAQAGVLVGDELLLIDGQDVRAFSEEELRRELSGAVGEPVSLTFARGDTVVRVTVERSLAEAYRLD